MYSVTYNLIIAPSIISLQYLTLIRQNLNGEVKMVEFVTHCDGDGKFV